MITETKQSPKKPGLRDAVCLTDSFVFTLGHCLNVEAMRYDLTGL